MSESQTSSKVIPFPDVQLPFSEAEMKGLGIYNLTTLRKEACKKATFLVEGLIFSESVNMVVGNSGLGKTPLLISLGLSVADRAATWMGREVQHGPVLYCDAESSQAQFMDTVDALCRHMGLVAKPPNFYIHSPNWEWSGGMFDRLGERVEKLRPKLVVIDPLRMFFSAAETSTEEAAAMVKQLRGLSSSCGCAWIFLHHRRKMNKNPQVGQVSLVDAPYDWLQEAAGSHALVNHTDTRLGIDDCENADLVVAGMVRGHGVATPMFLNRIFDDDGEPQGYVAVEGLKLLDDEEQTIYEKLPDSFRFKDLKVACGGGGSKSLRVLNQFLSAHLVKKSHDGRYVKTLTGVTSTQAARAA